jgi:hypothetical protein
VIVLQVITDSGLLPLVHGHGLEALGDLDEPVLLLNTQKAIIFKDRQVKGKV